MSGKKKRSDSDRYLYYKGFRIVKKTMLIQSLLFKDPETGESIRISYNENPKVENSEDKQYHLPRYVVKTLSTKELDKDPEFRKALKFKSKLDQKFHAKYRKAKAQVEWINRFQDKEETLEKYKSWRERNDIKNVKNDMLYLKNYIFEYFLCEQITSNPTLWPEYHNEFKIWLEKRKPARANARSKNKLAYNTLNNIIRTLNSFYSYLEEEDNKGPFNRCRPFPKYKTRKKDEKSVIPEKVQKMVIDEIEKLTMISGRGKVVPHPLKGKYKTLFNLLATSGMRKNEALGLSLSMIKFGKGREDYAFVHDALSDFGIKFYGFILLEDQPVLKSIRDKKTGKVPRRALKSKKVISPENARYIPLMNKEVAKELLELAKEQAKLFKGKEFGSDKSDYLLFDGITYYGLNKVISKIFEQKKFDKINPFQVHDLRHTFSTIFIAEKLRGSNIPVISKILGHSRSEITENYIHIHRLMSTRDEIETGIQDIELFDPDDLEAI